MLWCCRALVGGLLVITSCLLVRRIGGQQQQEVDVHQPVIPETTTGLSTLGPSLILVVTLDGNYYAVDKQTGKIKWTIQDEPTISIPSAVLDKEALLPDPKDGSLYSVNEDGTLKKFPFSIPQLVSTSPCRSSNGMLYTGRKIDTWYGIDLVTGVKQEILSTDSDKICPRAGPYSVFVGKTNFMMTMYDAKTGVKKWNVTYSCTIAQDVAQNYELTHFTTPSSGIAVTVDKTTGSLLWLQDYKSTIVGMYELDHNGLHTIPFTRVATETLAQSINRMLASNQRKLLMDDEQLYQKLFIGQSPHGFFASPLLVDGRTIASMRGPKLLTGPDNEAPLSCYYLDEDGVKVIHRDRKDMKDSDDRNKFLVSIGYYDLPQETEVGASSTLRIAAEEDVVKVQQTVPFAPQTSSDNGSSAKHFLPYDEGKQADTPWENSFLIILTLGVVGIIPVAMFLSPFVARKLVSRVESTVRGKVEGSGLGETEDKDPPSVMRVGKIEFYPKQMLGKGCEGTFVYGGKFDRRDVAVKRILPECFSIADREVDLLREADAHPNVVRYFSMEQDNMFRYIALERCAATMHDYIEGLVPWPEGLDPLTLLKEATMGLAHLHSLNIVHRDIKPQNVLVSFPSPHDGSMRAMISDFGLCKKLTNGKSSFSKRSGTTGTDGWIAPEMMDDDKRISCLVDIFSMGCVYFYVLMRGQHPFGSPLHRQANILSGCYDLGELVKKENYVAFTLIEKMVSSDPSERPNCSAILKHPIFWSAEYQMDFFQDVSDRIEKEPPVSDIIKCMQRGGYHVVKGDWTKHICEALQEDLKKFRTYRGRNVRDLLRAMRNKKHHYRELGEALQMSLGSTPGQFATYFTERFPQLLPHVYYAMQCCKKEASFKRYYGDYDFVIHWANKTKDEPQLSPESNWREASPRHKNKDDGDAEITDAKDADLGTIDTTTSEQQS